MKTNISRYGKIGSAVLFAIISHAATNLATAADFDARIASEKRSASVGLGRDSVDLLQRVDGPGANAVAANLLSRFNVDTVSKASAVYTNGLFKKTVTANQTTFVGDEGWSLQVYGDGSSVRYRNFRYLDDHKSMQVPVHKRPTNQKLEKLGRAFIEDKLGDLVSLGPDEELVPYFTQYEITGGGSTKKGAAMVPEMVHASTVVFTRSIDGLPVVGGGSKVAVIFANDGQAIGFDYDWPSYKKQGNRQRVLELARIKSRDRAFSKHLFGDQDVKELHFDCGYVDFGARKRDRNAPVQAGCMRQSVKKQVVDTAMHDRDQNSGFVMAASLDYIPAGENMKADAFWAKAKNVEPPRAIAPRR